MLSALLFCIFLDLLKARLPLFGVFSNTWCYLVVEFDFLLGDPSPNNEDAITDGPINSYYSKWLSIDE